MDSVKELEEKIAWDINNKCEYQLTINEYHKIRNSEYYSLVEKGLIVDNDTNWDDFDTYLASNLNIYW